MALATRVIGLVVLIDGTASAVYGHDFILWLMARLPRPLRVFVAPFERVPQPLFRAGAILQAIAGAYLLVREARVLPEAPRPARPYNFNDVRENRRV